MKLEYLADHPEWVHRLAALHHEEWGPLVRDWSAQQCLDELLSHSGRAVLPTTLVVVGDDGDLWGSASLIEEDIPELRDLPGPWLASVFVLPERRGHGAGRLLIEGVMRLAQRLGFERLHLFTEDKVALYEKLGWRVLELRPYHGALLSVMRWQV
ncbi:MAG: GNAT family N-acetyltransferase [Myxococcota bacterium]